MEKIKLLVFLCLLSISNVFTQISNEEYYLLTENADNLIENEQFDKANFGCCIWVEVNSCECNVEIQRIRKAIRSFI